MLGGVALSGCATDGAMTAPPMSRIDTLGFAAVPKSVADSVMVPAGYKAEVIYALGDRFLPALCLPQ